MKALVISLVVLLAVLHQDFWWWDDVEPLVFGFLPIGLAWHVGISLAAGFTGWLAVRYCWPEALEREDPSLLLGDGSAPPSGHGPEREKRGEALR